MSTTRKVLERVPDDRFDWKPHVKSFSLGELAGHVANLPTWGEETLTKSEIDLGTGQRPAAPPSKAVMLENFDRNVAAVRAALAGRSDADLMATWTLKRNGKTL